MNEAFEIVNTQPEDLESIFQLFEDSIAYQEKNGFPVWRNYDKNTLLRDQENKNQYKVLAGSTLGIVFSVCYTDKIIWRHLDDGTSVYLHRIVVNPVMKGRMLFGSILDWTTEHARQKGLKSIRMDTWASNHGLISYYQKFGFTFVENFTTPTTPDLPVHNRNLALALLEYKL